jgi:pimeloyl-ACP methyl ester carboxylesterase
MTTSGSYQEIFYRARDGLKLYARRYDAASATDFRPVVCLAGLTRNSRDFHDIAVALSTGRQPRTVYTLDMRGRGFSEHDPDWKNYAVPLEMLDVIDFMTLSGLHDAAFIATSRGGLISMLLAAAQPTLIGALVLNDIGPVIEPDGLARISGYVGRVPVPNSWADAARIVQNLNRRHFTAIPESMWEEVARQLYNERNGHPMPGYDAKIANSLSVLDGPMPALWPQFEALKRIPVLVLRGEHSDLLSQATVDEMRRRHPALAALTVRGQGHAPLLKDKPTIDAVTRFLNAADTGSSIATLAVA